MNIIGKLIYVSQGTFVDICKNKHADVSDACCNEDNTSKFGTLWVMKTMDIFSNHDMNCKLQQMGESRYAISKIFYYHSILSMR